MALNESLVDVYLSSLSQVQGPRSGPIGRLLAAKNVVGQHYDPGSQPLRVVLKQRSGFTALSTTLRSSFDGTVVTSDWSNPELLSSLDAQLVSICNSVPRIYNGSSWSTYPNVRAVTNQLRQKITHTSNHTIQAPSHAAIGETTCYVWTETQISDAVPVTTQYIAIQSSDGAWLRTPQILNTGNSGDKNLAKVTTDGTLFWVAFNAQPQVIRIKAYDTNGVELASQDIHLNNSSTPGYWDIEYLKQGTATYFIDPTGAQYTSTGGTWYFPNGSLLSSAAGGTLTISGDPSPQLNATFGIASASDPTTLDTVQHPVPTLTYSLPGSGSNNYLGSGQWTFGSSTLNVPVGASLSVTSIDNPTLNGSYTVSAWNNSTKVATMSPTVSGGGRLLGTTATVLITYAAPLPYSLSGSDVIAATYNVPGRVVLIQPTDGTGVTGIGVDFSRLTYSSGTITEDRVTDTTAFCTGPINWITNDTGDHLGYFATLVIGESPTITGWQTTGAGQTHRYATGQSVAQKKYLDSFIGWAEASNTHQPPINIGVGYLADGSSETTTGPLYDPGFRTTTVYNTAWNSFTTPKKTINSLIPVSKAFEHDGEYYAFTYYQSGTGTTITPVVTTVTHTVGDYMTGAQTQPIAITSGDSVQGSNFTTSGTSVATTQFLASTSISAGDTVAIYTVVAGDALNGNGILMPVGTQVLKWTFANAPSGGYPYAHLAIAASSSSTANGDWQILPSAGAATHTLYTRLYNNAGITAAPATFTATGSVQIFANAVYTVPALASIITDPATIPLYQNILVSGCLNSGNNGTKGIVYFTLDPTADPNSGYWRSPSQPPYVVVSLGSQVAEIHPSTIVLELLSPGRWSFANGAFDNSYVGTNLVIEQNTATDTTPATDLGSFAVTSTSGIFLQTNGADASALTSHFWTAPPYPNVSVNLPLGVQPYTFKLQSLGTLNYSFEGAYISVQSSPIAVDNGIYQVVAGGVDVANGLLYASPIDGSSNQVNRLFTSSEVISVIKQQSVIAPWQSCWFMTPLEAGQAQVGAFDRGAAYADWRVEGDATLGPNEFPGAVGNVSAIPGVGLKVCLPYRAESVTSTLPIATTRGQINLAGASVQATTVGLKTFELLDQPGQACLSSGELLLPGPMAGEFTLSGFAEDGINLSFEAPFLVTQSAASSGQLGLTLKQKYQYRVVGEFTDENGNRIYSPPSPALNVQMSGGNNIATIQGRSMNPLTSFGSPAAGTVGTSNRLVGIAIYRTAITGSGDNATRTVTHFKITNDLAINGLAPTSALNATGFTFPDEFTWQFVDQQPDISITAAESLYTDKGYLPRYPAPPFSRAVTWKGRTWVLAWDGSIWPSGEKTEGDAVWFHPALRIVLPTDDVPNALGVLEDNLIVFCEGGEIYQLPATTLPDATGRNGVLPSPILLPFKVSSTGYAVSLRGAVAFSSNDRGQSVWLITRDLKNVIASQQIMDSLAGQSINGMTIDSDQRLHVTTDSGSWFVYDQIIDLWTEYLLPTQTQLITTIDGVAAYQDANRVFRYDPFATVDSDGTLDHPIPPDVTIASINFGTVRGLKSVWEFQLIGTYKGPHNVTIVVSYPDEWQEPDTVLGPFTPDPTKPYVIPFYPMIEEAASYGIRVYVDFNGVISPGDSFEFELITASVGVDRSNGITKLPDAAGPTA